MVYEERKDNFWLTFVTKIIKNSESTPKGKEMKRKACENNNVTIIVIM